MRNKRAQSYIEFILAAFLFLTLIIFLFTALFVRTQPEAQKVSEQSSCQYARAILDFLTNEPGSPANWNKTTVKTLGLSNSTPGIINYTKWEMLETMNYTQAANAMPFNTSWVIGYQTFMSPNKTDSTCVIGIDDQGIMCRNAFGTAKYFYIEAFSDNPNSIFTLKLFFPEKKGIAIHAGGGPVPPPLYESEDNLTIDETADNGTLILVYFHTGPDDEPDSVTLDFTPAGGTPPVFYIQYAKYESLGGELPILINNLSIKNYFGAGIPSKGASGPSGVLPAKNYCSAKKRVNMASMQNAYGPELFPVDIEVIAWR